MRFEYQQASDVAFPALEDVHWVHDDVALYEGGTRGLLNEGALISALARPTFVMAYSDTLPDLLTLGAYLCHGVAAAHAYVDGNKRTGVLVMLAFLAMNGVSYDADEHEIGILMDHWHRERIFSVKVIERHLRLRCQWAR